MARQLDTQWGLVVKNVTDGCVENKLRLGLVVFVFVSSFVTLSTPMAYLLCTRPFTPFSHPHTLFQGTDTRRLTGGGLINPLASRTAEKHLLHNYSGGGMVSLARSCCCCINVPTRQHIEPILCNFSVSFGAHLLITGFWIGPDMEDGWGFVEASVHRIY
ncbi:hypothetical protein BUALT_Bualt19G0063000 [Buddleja alternifolia]|uniref:Uncharacterized protein n=1 Tax=Buddleja alternifolia TaxID=168488 RepID=A0AAV6W5G0_9LAMI|nr:hypothetical protein BUALT_Bualt19G0063000 [Buddleja alternifolia]